MTCDRLVPDTAAGTNVSRRSRASRRRWLPALLLCIAVQAMFPVQAYAWFGWLDDLSGPGPFWGGEFEFRFACLMDQPPLSEAIAHMQTAKALLPSKDDAIATALGDLNKEILSKAMDGTFKKKMELPNLLDRMKTQSVLTLPAEVAILQQSGPAATKSFPTESLAALEIARAADLLRESQVKHVSKWPGALLWANCHDQPSKNAERETGIRRQDRHPVLSFGLDYREYTNVRAFHWHTPNDPRYGLIHLSIIEPMVSWPLSGRFDVLDGQSGLGFYIFRTNKLSGKLARGLVVEPIRFDLHFPARLLDKNRHWYTKLWLSLSLRSGVVLFPAGFDQGAFQANVDEANRKLPGGEAIWENGISVDVGRLFFGR